MGAPFFNLTFGPLLVPLLLAMPIGQSLAWKRGDLLAAAQRVTAAAAIGLLVAIVGVAATRGGPVLVPIGLGVGAYVIIGAFSELVLRVRPRAMSLGTVAQRAWGLPRSAWGTAFAHAGLGMTVLGLAATGWGVERIVAIRAGDVVDLGSYQVNLVEFTPRGGPNYSEIVARMQVRNGGRVVAEIEPSKRAFTTRQMNVAEAGIVTLGSARSMSASATSMRWYDRCAALLETACRADLARRRGDGFRRLAFPVGPAAADWRGAAVPPAARGPPGHAYGSRMRFRALVLALSLAVAPLAAHAVQPDEILKDPCLKHVPAKSRPACVALVCQNQSIDDSSADSLGTSG